MFKFSAQAETRDDLEEQHKTAPLLHQLGCIRETTQNSPTLHAAGCIRHGWKGASASSILRSKLIPNIISLKSFQFYNSWMLKKIWIFILSPIPASERSGLLMSPVRHFFMTANWRPGHHIRLQQAVVYKGARHWKYPPKRDFGIPKLRLRPHSTRYTSSPKLL